MQVIGVGIPTAEDADEKEVYFVGIIDFLSRSVPAPLLWFLSPPDCRPGMIHRRYHWKKKIANAFKSIKWSQDQLSTVNPEFYFKRFTNYLPSVFVKTEH